VAIVRDDAVVAIGERGDRFSLRGEVGGDRGGLARAGVGAGRQEGAGLEVALEGAGRREGV
jgi:hypothetical protein